MKYELKTIEHDETCLRQISKEVDLGKENLEEEIKVLEQYCQENEVMAMAAVQLGIPKRIMYLKNTNLEVINKFQSDTASEEEENYNEAKVLINPIVKKQEGKTKYWEACASCLDKTGLVIRPYAVEIEYSDVKGQNQKERLEGFPATVFSHEYDHLNGILHFDIAEEVMDMKAEDRKKFRLEHNYEIISKTEPFTNKKG